MSSTQHQLIEQCATRLRGIVEALDNIHDTSPHRWSTDLDDVHSSAESLLALIKDQAPTQAAQGLAGAALAQPSPKCATCNDSGQIVVSGPHYQGEFQPPEYETEPCDMCAQPSTAQAEAERLREAYEWGYGDGQNNPNGYSDKKERDACVNELLKQPSPAQAEGAPVIGCLCGMPMTEGHHSQDGCSSLEEFAQHSAQAQAEQGEAAGCQGTNCGTTTGDHSPECLAEAAASQGWELKPEDLGEVEVAGYRSKESGMVYEQDYGLKNPEALMTVSQHERIDAARMSRIAKLEADTGALEWLRNTFKVHQALVEQAGCETIEQLAEQRDAALARVAELERQEPVALANRGLHAFWVKWTEAAAGLYGPGIKLYAAPVAQAQHSVPEGWKPVPIEPLLNMMSDKDHDTRITAERQLLSILAAAPGNSVPQAWLDVQAERRRQITAEGWTPEHDDQHGHGQMARAAACYALAGSSAPNDGTAALLVSLAWPWDQQWWKPTSARRDLVKACALALAEIERLDRAGISQSPQPGATTASS
ncbi:hypothetical protein [Pseudomonas aeruginosa]|uniref:hypothetical protein n=2 Tax=Pseudomonas aeruginosa TaxID=287 RepID=UPI0020A6C9C7|nr:hypothetical protein [Pseudomonas aeruginosa]